MTISTTTTPRVQYNGNGVTTIFSVPFVFGSSDSIVVILTEDSIDTTQTLTTDYTVSGGGTPAATGSITMISAPASGTVLTIYRDTNLTQELDYISYDAFPAESHESALDKLTLITQELSETQDRALTLPTTASGISTVLPTATANYYLRWNSAATALESVSLASLGSSTLSGVTNEVLISGSGAYTAGLSTTLVFPGTVKTTSTGIDYKSTNSNTVTLKAPASLSASYTLTLPADDGSSNYVLITDGNGVLSWSASTSGDVLSLATGGGSAGQVLTNGGAGTHSWVTPTVYATTTPSYVTLGTTTDLANERVLTAGTGITVTDAGAGSTVTISPNINGLTEDTSPDKASDFVMTYDASAATQKKVKLVNLASTSAMIIKTADEAITSDTTFSNDSTLTFSAAANTTYNILYSIQYESRSTTDFKFQITGPSSPTSVTGSYSCTLVNETDTVFDTNTIEHHRGTFSSFSSSQSINHTSDVMVGSLTITVKVVNGANAGTIAFQWAQDTSAADSTTVRHTSYLQYFVG